MTHLRRLAVLAALVVLLGCLPGVPAARALTCGSNDPAQLPGAIDETPVVLVHGFTANARSMAGVRQDLGTRLGEGYRTFAFDYAPANTAWPSDPRAATCLRDYIVALAAASAAGGGTGRVLAVAHSMGGIALRFALGGEPGRAAADVTAGVVTVGTPFRGSPWGGSGAAELLAVYKDYEGLVSRLIAGNPAGFSQLFPGGSTSAAQCLAIQQRNPCAPLPKWPDGLPVTTLATSVQVTTSFLGLFPATFHLGGDGIVGIDSAGVDSRSIRLPNGTTAGGSFIDSCTVDAGTSLYGAQLGGDALRAIPRLLGLFGSPNGDVAAAAATVVGAASAPCSHVHMLSFPPTLDRITTALEQVRPETRGQAYWRLDETCRGTSGPASDAACAARNALTEQVARETMAAFVEHWRARDREALIGLSVPEAGSVVADQALTYHVTSDPGDCQYDFPNGSLLCAVDVAEGDWGAGVRLRHVDHLLWLAAHVGPYDVG